MENLCCNKMSSFTNSSNSKLDSKLDSTKFETRYIQLFKVTDNAVIIVPNLSSKVKPVQYLSSTITAFDNFNSDCHRLVRE